MGYNMRLNAPPRRSRGDPSRPEIAERKPILAMLPSEQSSTSSDLASTSRYQSVRFLVVGLGGFIVDLSIVWVAIAGFGVADYVACVLGFAVATTGCYFAHQAWTFADAPSASAKQFAGFWVLTVSNLAIRLVLFTALGFVFLGDGYAIPLRLAIAGAVPFVFAYFLSSRLIFAASSAEQPPQA